MNEDYLVELNLINYDWLDLSDQEVLLTLSEKVLASEECEIDIISLASKPFGYSREPHFGIWVKKYPHLSTVFRKILYRIRHYIDTYKKIDNILLVILKEHIEKKCYDEFSFETLKHKAIFEIQLPILYAKEKKYSWFLRVCEGKISPKEMNLEQIKSIPINILFENETSVSRDKTFFLCPITKEKTPSFCWYKLTNSWYCFSCNKGGDIIDLIQYINNCSFKEAISILKKM